MVGITDIQYLPRNDYDASQKSNNTIYFVSENSEYASDMLSLYVGDAKQCDLLDISDNVTYNSIGDEVTITIPNDYKVPNKLYFVYNTKIPAYEAYCYRESDDEFVKVFGTPSHVVVCDTLPDISDPTDVQALEGYLYVDQQTKNSYIFNGTVYKEIIDLSDFIKIEDISQYVPVPDNVTIIKDPSTNIISAVGANVAGKTYTIGGQTLTAASGATIFNDYITNQNVGQNSNVFGSGNTNTGSNNVVFGGYNSVLGGSSTMIAGGFGNKLDSCSSTFVLGNSNGTPDSTHLNAVPVNLTLGFILGNSNKFEYVNESSGTFTDAFIFGHGNVIQDKANFRMVVGGTNLIKNGEQTLTVGSFNTINGNYLGAVIGRGNTISGVYEQPGSTYDPELQRTCHAFGSYLQNSASQSVPVSFITGLYNDNTITDSVFTIGNGTSSTRSDALRMSRSGLMQLCGTDGNAVTKNGETIESTRTTLTSIVADDSSYTSDYLPMNGQELILSATYTVSSITITSTATMNYNNGRGAATKSTTPDYNSVIIFKKDPSVTSVEDLMTNFTSSTSNKIYLLNKDLDITTYSIIHIMLFHDGFNICAIVSGYEEDVPV